MNSVARVERAHVVLVAGPRLVEPLEALLLHAEPQVAEARAGHRLVEVGLQLDRLLLELDRLDVAVLAHGRARDDAIQLGVRRIDRERPGASASYAFVSSRSHAIVAFIAIASTSSWLTASTSSSVLLRGVPLVLIDLDRGADLERARVLRIDRERRIEVVAHGREVVARLDDHLAPSRRAHRDGSG